MEKRQRSHGADETGNKYLAFRLADEEFALEIHHIREIIGMVNMKKATKAPEDVGGVINLRGSVIPVLDLRLRLGLPKRPKSRNSCIMVACIRHRSKVLNLGLQVDSVSEVLEIAAEDIEPPLPFGPLADKTCLLGTGRVGERKVVILSLAEVVRAEDQEFAQRQNAKCQL